jgi:hypothetical protein
MTRERLVSLPRNDFIYVPRKDVEIIRDMFSEMISFDESEDHEEPHENVYRLETQLSILLGDTDNAHMCWEDEEDFQGEGAI